MRLIVFIIISVLVSCGRKGEKNVIANCAVPQVSIIDSVKVCHGDSCSYVHYLMLSSYNEECFNDYNFVQIADKYIDSVQVQLPIAAIRFCKPFKFDKIGGSENDEQLDKHAIMEMWYKNQSSINKVPEISHIKIWTSKGAKSLDYINVESRQQTMDFYKNK